MNKLWFGLHLPLSSMRIPARPDRARRRSAAAHRRVRSTVTAVHVADLLAEGEVMPVYVHVIDHPDGRVLVDTGMNGLHP